MIATTYADQDIYLLDDAPEWGSGVRARVEMLSESDAGLTNREGRRAHGLTLRVAALTFTVVAEGVRARRFYGALRGYKAQAVVCPLWPAAVRWSERAAATINGGLKLVYRADWSVWEIFEGAAPVGFAPAASDRLVPLLWGRFERREIKWLTADALTCAIEFTESGPASYAVTPAAVTWTAGPSPSAAYIHGAPKVLPFTVNFDSVANTFTLEVRRDEIGFGRGVAETVYTQAVDREQNLGHDLETVAIGQMLRFFLDHGAGAPFWASNWVSAVVLTADVGALDEEIAVADTYAVAEGDWLAFCEGVTMGGAARILDITGLDLTLDDTVGPLVAARTLVSHLLLCRFQRPSLEIIWTNPDFAEVRLPLRELSQEYNIASDETLNVTQGLLPSRAYLYEFSRTLDGTVYYERFTSFENDLTYSAQTWAARHITHGEIKGGLYLDRDEVEVTAEVVAGTTLVQMATLKLEAPLMLRILAADTDGAAATNVAVIFKGEIVSATVTGARIVAKGITGGTLFDRMVPRFLFQRGCNHSLFSAGCALSRADWKFTATMFDVGAVGYPFTFVLHGLARVSGAAPTFFENWFAGGYIEMGSGTDWQRRAILLSSTVVAGAVTLTLDRDPVPYPAVSDAVIVYPGCDLTVESCKAYDAVRNATGKFDNYLNFGGHPFMPIANPVVVSASPNGQGKK